MIFKKRSKNKRRDKNWRKYYVPVLGRQFFDFYFILSPVSSASSLHDSLNSRQKWINGIQYLFWQSWSMGGISSFRFNCSSNAFYNFVQLLEISFVIKILVDFVSKGRNIWFLSPLVSSKWEKSILVFNFWMIKFTITSKNITVSFIILKLKSNTLPSKNIQNEQN